MAKRPLRPDKSGTHRTVYESNRKKILKTQSVCGICGQPVDKRLKPPNPLAPVIDHIIPIAKGGHPSDINNLQLAHATCNRQKSDKLFVNPGKNGKQTGANKTETLGNRNLPHIENWAAYKSEK